VYFFETLQGVQKMKSRGFDPSSVSRETILNAWKDGSISRVKGISRKFITFGMIATGQKDDTIRRNMARLCNWETSERELGLFPLNTKRHNLLNDEYTTKRKPSNGLMKTYPKVNEEYIYEGHMSTAYRYIYSVPYNKLTETEREYLMELEDIQEESML
jgi:hypothetical protein